MGNPPSPTRWFRLSCVIVLVALTVYNAPYFATTIVLKSKAIPYSLAPDLSLYLNLSRMGSSHVNPYFGTISPSGELGYTTFDTAFRMLGVLAKIAGNDLWWAVLLWNLFWWGALYVGAIWFIRRALPEATELILCLAMSLILFFNFGVLKALASAWLHFPSMSGFAELSLPFIRVIFPQVPLAMLFFYLALQTRALDSWRWREWTGMFFLQAIAFAMFPYATLIMAWNHRCGCDRSGCGKENAQATLDAGWIWCGLRNVRHRFPAAPSVGGRATFKAGPDQPSSVACIRIGRWRIAAAGRPHPRNCDLAACGVSYRKVDYRRPRYCEHPSDAWRQCVPTGAPGVASWRVFHSHHNFPGNYLSCSRSVRPLSSQIHVAPLRLSCGYCARNRNRIAPCLFRLPAFLSGKQQESRTCVRDAVTEPDQGRSGHCSRRERR
jgi:hypothetical protein